MEKYTGNNIGGHETAKPAATVDIPAVIAKAEKYIEEHPLDLSTKDVLRNPHTGETKTKEQVIKDKYFSADPKESEREEIPFSVLDDELFLAEIDDALGNIILATDLNNDGHSDSKKEQSKYEKIRAELMTVHQLKEGARNAEIPLVYYLENRDFLQAQSLRLLRRIRRLGLSLPNNLLEKYTAIDFAKDDVREYEKFILNLEKGFVFVKRLESLKLDFDLENRKAFMGALFILFDRKAKDYKRMGAEEKSALQSLALAFKAKYIFENRQPLDLEEKLAQYIQKEDSDNEREEIKKNEEIVDAAAIQEIEEEAIVETPEEQVVDLPALKENILEGIKKEEEEKIPVESPEEIKEKEIKVATITNFEDLYKYIEEISPIVGNNASYIYAPGELETKIKEAIDLDDRSNIDFVSRKYGIRDKVIELFREKIVPSFTNLKDIEKAMVAFAALRHFAPLFEAMTEIEKGNSAEVQYEDEYGLVGQAKRIWKVEHDLKIIESKEESAEELAVEEIQELGSPEEAEKIKLPDESLAEVDLLTTLEEEKRKSFEKEYSNFLNLYKKELVEVKNRARLAEDRAREIKNTEFDTERLDKDEQYLKLYGTVCRELVGICVQLESFDREINRLELLNEKYAGHFDEIKANSRLALPIQRNEEKWLNEISEGSESLNYISLVIADKVHGVRLDEKADGLQLSFEKGQADDLMRSNGNKWEEISDSKNIEAADAHKIDKWMDYGLVIENADYLTKLRKRQLFYGLQKSRSALAFSVEKKYGTILPALKSNVPIYFKLGQSRISKAFLEKTEARVGAYIKGLNKEENRAYIETVLYQGVLEDPTITMAQLEQIKNRLNALLIKYKNIKPLLDRKPEAYEHLKLLQNGLYAVEKRGEIRQKMMDKRRRLIKPDEKEVEENLSIPEEDAAGKVYINHKADIEDVAKEMAEEVARLEAQKEMKAEFIENYLVYNLKAQALKYDWPKKNIKDFVWFIQNPVAKLLENKDLPTKMSMIEYLEMYPEMISKENPLYDSYLYLRDNLLYLE